MGYEIEFKKSVKKDFNKIGKLEAKKIFIILKEFANNFCDEYERSLLKSGKIKNLKGTWSGFYRLRIRTFRVIYQKNDNKLVIFIFRIANRKDIYK